MKRIAYIAVIFFMLLSCGPRKEYGEALQRAEAMMNDHPDSALLILEQLKDTMQHVGKADRMYYELLFADAQNKTYVDFTTDSIMKEVAHYYDRHGSANERMRAHYLLGCSYRDMGEAPMALQCYQEAVECADTTSKECNYRLMTSIYGQMAEIFHKQNLPTDEIAARKNCQKYSLLAHDTLVYIKSYELMVKPYFLLGDTAAILKVLDKAYWLYLGRNDSMQAARIYGNSIYVEKLVREGDLVEARKRIDVFKKKSEYFNADGIIQNRAGLPSYYYILYLFYMKNSQPDSAELYIRRLLSYKGYQSDAYRGLLSIYQQAGNTDSIVKYAQLYEAALDSLSNTRRTETIHEMTSMYNYQRFQDQANKSTRLAERTKWIAITIILLLFIIALTIIYHYRVLQKERMHRIREITYKYNDTLMKYDIVQEELSNLRINDESVLADKEEEICILRKKLGVYQNMLDGLNTHSQLSKFRESGVITLLKSRLSRRVVPVVSEDAVWLKLTEQFSFLAPTAYSLVGKDDLLSPLELRMCILLLAGFTNNEINLLLNTSPQNATNIKAKANRKLFNEDSAASLKSNLMSIYS